MSQPAAVSSASLARGSPRCQAWSSLPRFPSGCSRLWSGPATKPSSEIDMWQVVSGIRGPFDLQWRRAIYAPAGSHPGAQDVDLAAGRRRVEPVLDQPADHGQAPQRPPPADHVAVDLGAVAGEDVVQVLLVPERQAGEIPEGVAAARLGPVDHAGDRVIAVDEDMRDLEVAVREHGRPRPKRGRGDLAVARHQVGGQDAVGDQPRAFAIELRLQLLTGAARPWRQRRVVQPPQRGTRRRPRRRRRGGRLAEAAQRRSRNGREREHGRLAPQDLGRRDRRQGDRLDLDVDTGPIGIDLQEYVADAQGRPRAVSDDHLDLIHGGDHRRAESHGDAGRADQRRTRQNRELMLEPEVLEVLTALEEAGCRFWIAGGWGVDALVGAQTREHRDLDLAIDAAREAGVLAALAGLGYAVETDWRPARVQLAADG